MSNTNGKVRFGHDDGATDDAVIDDQTPANSDDDEAGVIDDEVGRHSQLEGSNTEQSFDHHQTAATQFNNVKKTIQREDTMKTTNVHPFVDKSSSRSQKPTNRLSPSMHKQTPATDENGSVVIDFDNSILTNDHQYCSHNDDAPTSTSTTVDDQYFPRTDSSNTFKMNNTKYKDHIIEFNRYDDDIVQYENDILGKLLADTGRWSFGIKVIELWILDEGETYLYRPSSGYWIDPVYGYGDTLETDHQRDCLRRLFDESYSNYIPPTPVVPGESLVGNLWALSSSIGPTHSRGNSSVGSHNSGTRSWLGGGGSANSAFRSTTATPNIATSSSTVLLDAVRHLSHFQGNHHNNQHHPHPLHQPSSSAYRRRKIVWRDVASIANDPDQPWNYRLQALSNIGLGWAAGIPFHTLGGGKGIVVFMARDTVDMHRLTSLENEDYLLGATESIGATYSCFIPRRKAIIQRKQEMDYTWNRVRRKFVHQSTNSTITNGTTSHRQPQNADTTHHKWDFDIDNTSLQLSDNKSYHQPYGRLSDGIEWLQKKLLTSIHKLRGGNMQIPPVFSWNQTFVSFTGVLFTIYIVAIFNTYFIIPKLGPSCGVPLGLYGALVTLQFGLTSAPAAQPRNVFFGQLVSIIIAIAISYLDFLPNPYKQALAVATAVAVMVRSSLTHPPAGASALIYSTGEVRWGSFFFFMVGNVIAIIMAIFINNLSSKRHYPTYWGSIPYVDDLFGRMTIKKDEQESFVRHQTQRLSI